MSPEVEFEALALNIKKIFIVGTMCAMSKV